MCDRKKKEENERWERMVKEMRSEGQIWGVINRERRRKKEINEDIKMNEWKEYFVILLEEVEEKVVWEREKSEVARRGQIKRKEVVRAIGKIKNGKTAFGDGIPGEVWKYGREALKSWIWEICDKVWREEGWPEEESK